MIDDARFLRFVVTVVALALVMILAMVSSCEAERLAGCEETLRDCMASDRPAVECTWLSERRTCGR